LNPEQHFSRREYVYDFYGIETFTNHSCNPNCLHEQVTDTNYKMIAIKDIAEGDEITCDYNDIVSEYDTHQFTCLCGEKYCRGIII
jgi:SET domain-containing protein